MSHFSVSYDCVSGTIDKRIRTVRAKHINKIFLKCGITNRRRRPFRPTRSEHGNPFKSDRNRDDVGKKTWPMRSSPDFGEFLWLTGSISCNIFDFGESTPMVHQIWFVTKPLAFNFCPHRAAFLLVTTQV